MAVEPLLSILWGGGGGSGGTGSREGRCSLFPSPPTPFSLLLGSGPKNYQFFGLELLDTSTFCLHYCRVPQGTYNSHKKNTFCFVFRRKVKIFVNYFLTGACLFYITGRPIFFSTLTWAAGTQICFVVLISFLDLEIFRLFLTVKDNSVGNFSG